MWDVVVKMDRFHRRAENVASSRPPPYFSGWEFSCDLQQLNIQIIICIQLR